MPDEGRKQDEVEKILSDENSLVDRKKALIDGMLKEREAAIRSFDEKLARLGYRANCAKPKPRHHKKPAPPSPEPVVRLGARPKA